MPPGGANRAAVAGVAELRRDAMRAPVAALDREILGYRRGDREQRLARLRRSRGRPAPPARHWRRFEARGRFAQSGFRSPAMRPGACSSARRSSAWLARLIPLRASERHRQPERQQRDRKHEQHLRRGRQSREAFAHHRALMTSAGASTEPAEQIPEVGRDVLAQCVVIDRAQRATDIGGTARSLLPARPVPLVARRRLATVRPWPPAGDRLRCCHSTSRPPKAIRNPRAQQ